MSEEKLTYMESKIDAHVTHDKEKIDIVFHRAKVKLHDELEINLLKSVNPEFNREFILTDDQLIIRNFPPSTYEPLHKVYEKNNQSKWQLAYNVIQRIERHSLSRLKLWVSPENILFDQGLMPHFLHYGVTESIPPYEDDKERLWKETKATVATIVDQKYDFLSYLSHHETIDLTPVTKQIMAADSYEELLSVADENIKKDEAYERTVTHIPKKKWKVQRYSILALGVLLIPAIILSVYGFFFKIPESQAYVESNRYFMQNQYSSVVESLSGFDDEKMPYSVQYQLATAYMMNESLTEEQRANVDNTLTLQSDDRYFLYWINIGRGNYQEAIDHARLLEDRDLIVYGLLQEREYVKTDENLSGDEREAKLDSIQREMDEYLEEMQEELKEHEEQEESNTTSER